MNSTSPPPRDVAALEPALLRALDSGRAALPVLPESAAESLELARREDVNFKLLAERIERDPPIAARMISAANSAFYAGATKTGTVVDAIVRVGLLGTRDLLFQAAYATMASRMVRYQPQVSASFERSVRCAIVARSLATLLPAPNQYAYLAGLLHDIGEARIFRIVSAWPEIADAEPVIEDLVRRFHTRAGAELASRWSLPDEIVTACAAHHDDATFADASVQLVMAADRVMAAVVAGTSPDDVPSDLFADLDKLALPVGAHRVAMSSVLEAPET